MPRQTNDFQSLMFLIQSQLAPTGAEVRESAMVADEAIDSDREIDIVISDPTGKLPPQRVAIECRDRGRKANVEWIDALIGKYSSIQVRKVVAISRSGFTANARKKAAHAGIETLLLGEALAADWATAVRNVVAALMRSHLGTRMRSELLFSDGRPPVLLEEQPDYLSATLHRADGSLLFSVGALAIALFEGPLMQQQLAENAKHLTPAEPYLFARLAWESPAGGYLVTQSGERQPVLELAVLARCKTEDVRIILEHRSLGRARIAFGSANTFGHRVHAAVSQEPGSQLKAGVLIRPLKPDRKGTKRRRP